MKVLNIVSSGYRATLEEQDDTVLWISQTLRRAGADLDLLLRSSAANYVVEGQRVEPLSLGGRTQRNAPDVHAQVRDLVANGAAVFVLQQDLQAYGVPADMMFEGVQIVSSSELPSVLAAYDRVWHW